MRPKTLQRRLVLHNSIIVRILTTKQKVPLVVKRGVSTCTSPSAKHSGGQEGPFLTKRNGGKKKKPILICFSGLSNAKRKEVERMLAGKASRCGDTYNRSEQTVSKRARTEDLGPRGVTVVENAIRVVRCQVGDIAQ